MTAAIHGKKQTDQHSSENANFVNLSKYNMYVRTYLLIVPNEIWVCRTHMYVVEASLGGKLLAYFLLGAG